ncbi:hypothetical protein I656_02439 [Geobacillus sp. WSUCF1]|nr:hypothetical protein I656_02439 [Geobacillus sp. WSUCF1]
MISTFLLMDSRLLVHFFLSFLSYWKRVKRKSKMIGGKG